MRFTYLYRVLEVKNEWNYEPSSICAFMACSGTHRLVPVHGVMLTHRLVPVHGVMLAHRLVPVHGVMLAQFG